MNELKRSQKRVKLKGKTNVVVREQYLRNDILCHSPLCKNCEIPKSYLSKPMVLFKEATHYVIPCFDVVQKYLEVLELPDITGIIILQSIASKVLSTLGRGYFRRLIGLSRNGSCGCAVFLNEICEKSSIERLSSETEEEWLFNCAVETAKYYSEHLQAVLPIIVITENSKVHAADKHLNVKIMDLRTYLEEMCENSKNVIELFDSISIANTILQNKDDAELKSYDSYYPSDVLLSGVKSGRFFRGVIRVNKYMSSQEAYVTTYEKLGEVLIFGMKHRNRAIHGDEVVIEMLVKSEWKEKISLLSDSNGSKGEILQSLTEDSTTSSVMPTGKVVGIFERRWRDYVATLPEVNEENNSSSKYKNVEKILAIPYDYRIPRIRIATMQADLLRNQRLIVRIDSWDKDSQYPNGHFVRTLGQLGQLETEVTSLLVENGISAEDFPNSLLHELPESNKDDEWKVDEAEVSKRRDLRNSHLIFSIDPKGCEDVDDTLSIKELPNGNIELGVHIADVTHFVKPFSLTDLEAQSRSTSVYLPDRRFDMLPNVLSADLCSLLGNVDRYAVSVIWILDSQFNVQNVWYGRTVIRSSYKLSYEDAEDILNGYSVNVMKKKITELQNLAESDLINRYDKLKSAVINLVKVSKALRSKRLVAGGLELNNINIKFEIDQVLPSVITEFHQVKELEVHKTVAECMIFANNWVAKQISTVFPQQAVLRHHPIPREQALIELQKLASSKGFNFRINSNKELAQSLMEAHDPNDEAVNQIFRILATRAMNQATYFCSGSVAVEDYYHYGLGISHYTHFTSPIRRYSDVLVHRLLLASVKELSDDVVLKVSDLESLCEHMNTKHSCAQSVEKSAQELFQAHYFSEQKNGDCITSAIIYSIKKNGLLVLTPQYGIKGAICLQNKEKKVAIVQSDGVHWCDGSIETTPTNLTIKTADSSQVYSIFDHITVSIIIQRTRAHQPKIILDIVDNKPHVTSPTSRASVSNSEKIGEIEEFASPEDEEMPEHSNKEQNLYSLLHCLRQMTLLANEE